MKIEVVLDDGTLMVFKKDVEPENAYEEAETVLRNGLRTDGENGDRTYFPPHRILEINVSQDD